MHFWAGEEKERQLAFLVVFLQSLQKLALLALQPRVPLDGVVGERTKLCETVTLALTVSPSVSSRLVSLSGEQRRLTGLRLAHLRAQLGELGSQLVAVRVEHRAHLDDRRLVLVLGVPRAGWTKSSRRRKSA